MSAPRPWWKRLPPGRSVLPAAIAFAVGVVCIDTARAPLAETHKSVKELHDTYFLPPPEQVVTMSLGYRSAVADLLWSHVLVAQGMRTQQRRRFENLVRLYEAINTLDPTWRAPYTMADALITFQTEAAPFEEIVAARTILERGVHHRPLDAELWLNLGQFVAIMAPSSYLDDHPAVAKQWEQEGIPMLLRAAELGAVGGALAGPSMLLRKGKREAAIRFYERAYAVSSSESEKEYIAARLGKLLHERDLHARQELEEAFEHASKDGLPFLSKDEAMALGPRAHPGACAGPGHRDAPHCASSWREWFERREQAAANE